MEAAKIFITGASSGIGYGAAKELVKRGHFVFGSVRKQEDADRVSAGLGDSFFPVLMDVADQGSIDQAITTITSALKGSRLDGLINNSGISVSGPIELLSVDQIISNFDINVFGLLRVTKACLSLLAIPKPGASARILNISSIAGKLSAPYMGPYNGTKHAVEALSNTMRMEFKRYGIDVVIIGPGPIQTPIWDKSSLKQFEGTAYYDSCLRFFRKFTRIGKSGMPLAECSRQIADIFEVSKPKTRYTIMKNKFMGFTLPSIMPDRMLDSYFAKEM